MRESLADEPLFKQCSLNGLYRMLRTLREAKGRGRTASDLARASGLGSLAQTKKYIKLGMALRSVSRRRRYMSTKADSILVVVYDLTSDGFDLLNFLEKFDMANVVFKEPIGERATQKRI